MDLKHSVSHVLFMDRETPKGGGAEGRNVDKNHKILYKMVVLYLSVKKLNWKSPCNVNVLSRSKINLVQQLCSYCTTGLKSSF